MKNILALAVMYAELYQVTHLSQVLFQFYSSFIESIILQTT